MLKASKMLKDEILNIIIEDVKGVLNGYNKYDISYLVCENWGLECIGAVFHRTIYTGDRTIYYEIDTEQQRLVINKTVEGDTVHLLYTFPTDLIEQLDDHAKHTWLVGSGV